MLASTSSYRRQLLDRLRVPYRVAKPDVDEQPLPAETPDALSERLAQAKATAVQAAFPDAWIIGSDQVCERDGKSIGKSGDMATAMAQLRSASGRKLRFHTAVCVLHGEQHQLHRDCTDVQFRKLDDHEIERYLQAEKPFDCAGSFKCEGLGISLFESIRSDDPTALIGLPLIALARMLRAAGFMVP
ncbi:MAG: Maf family nucleotide pyrophosphatase [Lysobacteraceae bacterium]